jgi:hypothetical protein
LMFLLGRACVWWNICIVLTTHHPGKYLKHQV